MFGSRSMPYTISVGIVLLAFAWVARSQYHPAPEESFALPMMGRGRAASPAQRKAVILTITAQLEAFKKDDYKTALTYQSGSLRRRFRSPADFQQMMVAHYPEFAHYKSVQFGRVESDAMELHATVPVMVTGQNGREMGARYYMRREGNVYRVESVMGGDAPPTVNT